MKTQIKTILKKLARLNKKAELEQIRIEFELAKELICTAIEADNSASTLQKQYLQDIVPNVKYITLYKSDYITIIDYICSVVEVVIHSAPLDKRFSKIKTTDSIKIIQRINRVLTGRSYIVKGQDFLERSFNVEVQNLEWNTDDFDDSDFYDDCYDIEKW